MSSATIKARIAAGLARAVSATGSATSEKVYLVSKTNTGGNTPINPPVISETDVELVDALFKSYDQGMFSATIQAGDRQLVSQHSVEIKTGDTIKQGSALFTVVSVDVKSPTSDTLLYISQLRGK